VSKKKKDVPAIALPSYSNSMTVFEGTCVVCNLKNTKYQWEDTEKKIKATPLGEMYCSKCRVNTVHSHIHVIEKR
jgi:hypothetical protein